MNIPLGDIAISSKHRLPLIILGAGYTGRFLYQQARNDGWKVFATSRTPDTHLPYVEPSARIFFDLEQQNTWENLPNPANIVWCFPALPQPTASMFAKEITSQGSRILLLGSTSAYPPKHDGHTDEQAPLNMTLPRVQSEEHLRETYGAVVLRLAGLYGPGRHVLNWIRRGKIKNTNRYVNLIHIEDVAALGLAAIQKAPAESSYIVSDDRPRLWSDICQYASTQWNMPIPEPTIPNDFGKQLSSQKILKALSFKLQHPNLYEELDKIEREGKRLLRNE